MEQDSTTQAMAAAGVDTEDSLFEDYFGFDEKQTFYLPDGKQYIEFQVMTEGKRAQYQRATNRDITLQRTTGDAKMKVDPATDRQELLKASVVGWHIVRHHPNKGAKSDPASWVPVPFSIGSPGGEFEKWLAGTNPKIVDALEKAVRKSNPWLMAEMSVEDIDKEIENLHEMREEAVKRERGEGASSSR